MFGRATITLGLYDVGIDDILVFTYIYFSLLIYFLTCLFLCLHHFQAGGHNLEATKPGLVV